MRPGPSERAVVAILADTDSRWKWAKGVAGLIGSDAPVCLQTPTPRAPSERQYRECGVDPEQIIPTAIGDLPAALEKVGCTVLIIGLPGDAGQAALQALASAEPADRPIVIVGYVGVVYERVIEGLLLRAGADLVLANSPHDARVFRDHFRTYGVDPDTVVETRLPYLGTPPTTSPGNRPFTVAFAAQPSVPPSQKERRYIVKRLIEHARIHPEREVVLKLRALPGERATHAEPYPYPRLVAEHKELPKNFTMASGPMHELLGRTDLLLTVSSTAAMEAIRAGIPTGVLTDFGIGDDLGTSFYAASGCYTSFAAIDAGARPVAEPSWAEDNGLSPLGEPSLQARLDDLSHRRPLPPLAPYYTLANASSYLPRVLAANGLNPDGTKRQTSFRSDGPLKRLSRNLVHKLYRAGAQVIAPLLRRLGSL